MLRFRIYMDKDRETAWLNRMSEKGWAMTRFFMGFYWFAACAPGEYLYQVDFGRKFGLVTKEYREFMEGIGVEIVQTWGFWIIVRRPASEGAFELYTDLDSALAHYGSIRKMFRVGLAVELACFFMELWAAVSGFAAGWFFVCLIGLVVAAFLNMNMQLNDTIAELKERKGEPAECCSRRVSPLVPCGLLLNSIALLFLNDEAWHGIKLGTQIAAIVLMLAGIVVTGRGRKRQGR